MEERFKITDKKWRSKPSYLVRMDNGVLLQTHSVFLAIEKLTKKNSDYPTQNQIISFVYAMEYCE